MKLAAACILAAVLSAPLAAAEMGFVAPAPGGGFVLDGKPWRPFGCNYFDPRVGWAPKLWQRFDPVRVEGHFRAMRELGVNVVRVFLTAGSFYRDPPAIDPEGLAKFDRLLAIAKVHEILVHPTGPDHWEGSPRWRQGDIYADPKALVTSHDTVTKPSAPGPKAMLSVSAPTMMVPFAIVHVYVHPVWTGTDAA